MLSVYVRLRPIYDPPSVWLRGHMDKLSERAAPWRMTFAAKSRTGAAYLFVLC